MRQKQLFTTTIPTPLGAMTAIADEQALYALRFVDDTKALDSFIKKAGAQLIDGSCQPLDLITQEVAAYFAGTLTRFTTPLAFIGSSFEQKTWQALSTIAYGTTQSYSDLAKTIEQPTAHRAAAGANSRNNLAIIIPCHRIINANGKLGGYNGGIERKQWLLNHEKRV